MTDPHPTAVPAPDAGGRIDADDGASLSDAELRALLERAKATGDEPLRRLLASYVTLRRLSAELIGVVETREGAQTIVRTPIFLRLRELTRRTAT